MNDFQENEKFKQNFKLRWQIVKSSIISGSRGGVGTAAAAPGQGR